MASLYEIDAEILECIDMETGEIIDSVRLDALQMEREQKIEAVALWVKNLVSDADAITAEIQRLAERKASALRKAEQLKVWITNATGGQKMSTARAAISFRASERVEIADNDAVPKKYLVKKVTFTPDKSLIRKAIKEGHRVKGCSVVQYTNISIK